MEQDIIIQEKTAALSTNFNESKYINLLTDYGLKSVLKVNELAISFLNDLLQETTHIKKISYLDKEVTGKYKYHRTAVFDLLCEDDQSREFIVEIQRIHQEYFLDRSLYYASAHIQHNAPKGKTAFKDWDYNQKPIIFIGILDFDIKDSRPDKFKYFVQLCDVEDKKVMYEKLSFIYLELPKFERLMGQDLLGESANLNKWLYAIKKLHTLEKAPDFLKEGPFKRLLEIAELANMTKKQKNDYELSLKRLADEYATNKTSFNKGIDKGIEIGLAKGEEIGRVKGEEIGLAKGEEIGLANKTIEVIKTLLTMGKLSVSEIANITSVDEAYVLKIKSGMEHEEK